MTEHHEPETHQAESKSVTPMSLTSDIEHPGGIDIDSKEVEVGNDIVGRDKTVGGDEVHGSKNIFEFRPGDSPETKRFKKLLGENAYRNEIEKHFDSKRKAGQRPSFSRSDLRNAPLGKLDLHDADFISTELSECILTEANLRGSDFREAKLIRAQLRGADLSGADLRNAILTDADLSEVQVRRCQPARSEIFRDYTKSFRFEQRHHV